MRRGEAPFAPRNDEGNLSTRQGELRNFAASGGLV